MVTLRIVKNLFLTFNIFAQNRCRKRYTIGAVPHRAPSVCQIVAKTQIITQWGCSHCVQTLFDRILKAEDFSASKPDPQCYLLGAEVFGLKPEECVVF